MIKKIISGLFALALITATGYGVINNIKKDNTISEFGIINIEALASNEGEIDYNKLHDCYDRITSSGNTIMTHITYCGTCKPLLCRSWDKKSTCYAN